MENPKYKYENVLTAFFIGKKNSTYSNNRFDKVRNVKKEFVIFDNISKYHFLQYETIINAYLYDINMYKEMCEILEKRLARKEEKSKIVRGSQEYQSSLVITKTEDLVKKQLDYCISAIEETKKRMQERIESLLEERTKE